MTGKTILHYEIYEQIGHGGMGTVYRAKDLRLGRNVCIKFLPATLANDLDIKAQLESEAKAVGLLNHPNIAVLYDFHNIDNTFFLAMEYIKGKTLKELIQLKGKFPEKEALQILKSIAAGLNHAHKNGIIHRDIKSENIMISDDGQIKILDFGLAKLKSSPSSQNTERRYGTPNYMSPEQVEGKPTDERSDIWALGIIFYEMLTGELPFTANEDAEILIAILQHPIPPLKIFNNKKRKTLVTILKRLLAKNPDNRYRDIDSLLYTLNLHQKYIVRDQKSRSLGKVPIFFVLLTLIMALTTYMVKFRFPETPLWLSNKSIMKPLTTKVGEEQGGISPDGQSVVSYSVDGRLYIKNISTNRIKYLNNRTKDTHYLPTWAPDGESIYYLGGFLSSICKIDSSSDAPQEIIKHEGAGTILSFAISPSSRYISYVKFLENQNKNQLELILYDTKEHIEIPIYTKQALSNVTASHSAWHPDERVMAFMDISPKGKPIICFFDLVKLKILPDTLNTHYNRRAWFKGGLAYSPDGKYLVYPDSANHGVELVAREMEKNGTKSKSPKIIITKFYGTATPSFPVFTHDNRILSFVKSTTNRDVAIAPFDLDNLVIRDQINQLTLTKSDDHNASWSPDGSKICFYSNQDGQPDIYIWNKDTGIKRLTATQTREDQIQFTPDGNFISFLVQQNLFITDIENPKNTKRINLGLDENILSYCWGNNNNILILELLSTEKNNSTKIIKMILNDRKITTLATLPFYSTKRILKYSRSTNSVALEAIYGLKEHQTQIGYIDIETGLLKECLSRSGIVPRGDISWTPEGKHLLYGQHPLDRTPFRFEILNLESGKTFPVKMENKSLFFYPGEVSPKGDEIILEKINFETDVWAIGELPDKKW